MDMIAIDCHTQFPWGRREIKIPTQPRLSERIKLEKKFEFRKKGNQIQAEFNEAVAASMEEVAASLEEKEDLAKMKEALQEGLKLLSERQKLLNITVIISPVNSFARCAFPDRTLINRATHCH